MLSDDNLDVLIGHAAERDYLGIAELTRTSIPNALVSQLGVKFGAIYYRALVESDGSCGFVGHDKSGAVVGVLIGALDTSTLQQKVLRSEIFSLISAANMRIFKPSVLRWILSGVRSRLHYHNRNIAADESAANDSKAELLVIAVTEKQKGSGLSTRLVGCFEDFIRANVSHKEGYRILTETSNLTANSFYQRIGAERKFTTVHHGREIVQWIKRL